MKWWKRIWLKLSKTLGINMQFSLIDFDDRTHNISTDEIHTIIQDAYTIYVIYKKEGSYQIFQNSATNRANLPNIRLAQEINKK